MPHTFEIPESRYRLLLARVAKAAARAPRSGLPVPAMVAVSRRLQEYRVHDALARIRGERSDVRSVYLPMVTVELNNFAPEIGEWAISGYRTVRRVLNEGTVVTNSGKVPEAKAGAALCCDHCGYRRLRHSTFIVENLGTGELHEVGSTCLEAFIGYGSGYLSDLQEIGSILREIEAAARSDLLSGGYDLEEEVRTVLAVAFRRVSDFGFVGSSLARETGQEPTWRGVFDDLAASRHPDAREEDMTVTAADFMVADDIVASYADTPPDCGFEGAVRTAIDRGLASVRDIAVLTAAASVHIDRTRKEALLRTARKMSAGSEDVGQAGERLAFVGKVQRIASFQGRYGERCYVTMFDADGNLMLWKTGGGHGLEEGHAYEMKGTVKEHRTCERGRYAGARETVMTRVAVIAGLGPVSFDAAAPSMSVEDAEALDSLLSGPLPF